ncbi:HYOU1 [Acanthosepion pharaonis]|uniref:Hypoxia up-regulated protein 1 n=1 Tax=Acanthosepion pharaonis TaxID=158019 RepID=A0A812B0K3_ACAPH|nr:HYOU1 [Sepia pharaonis]
MQFQCDVNRLQWIDQWECATWMGCLVSNSDTLTANFLDSGGRDSLPKLLEVLSKCLKGSYHQSSESIAVMSVDLGNQFMKIAIVKPGVPMEIVLNLESKRKTASLVALRNEREFSDMAQTTQVRFPLTAYWYLLDVIGKQFEDPAVAKYQKRFPYYTLVRDENRGTVLFKINGETFYSPEELLAMLLEYCKHLAEEFAEQPIKDAVVTVPPHFNQAERKAVRDAAQIAGLNLLQLMSDNAAVALNYGVFRRKDFDSKPQYIMFYDMGASYTSATIVGYMLQKSKEGSRVESNPQLTIHGVAFDNTLGGLEMTLRLQKYFADEFNKQKQTKTDVYTNLRSMAKLFKEAERVKMVLSANSEHYAQIENLLEEKDFRLLVTRNHIEKLFADLFDRVVIPVQKVIESSGISLSEIGDVILMGGCTRIPKVQEMLLKFLKRNELGKSINTDEAAAMGAVYQAAHLSQGFKVKKFLVKEATVYPIIVEFQRQRPNEDGSSSSKSVKRTLFGRNNAYPIKKVMTFNKHNNDFNFGVSYGDLDFLDPEHRKSFSSLILQNITLTGVGDAHSKHASNAEYKGVRAHFRMDESGLLHLDGAESVFEKSPEGDEKEESAWSKLGNTLSGFFRGKQDENAEGAITPEEGTDSKSSSPEADATQTAGDTSSTAGQEDKTATKEEKIEKPAGKAEEKSEKSSEQEKSEKPESNKEKVNEGTAKPDATNQTNTTQDKAEAIKAKKPTILKENLKIDIALMDLVPMPEGTMKASKNRLALLKQKDEEKKALERSKNELEAFIFDIQDKLAQDDYIKCSTEEQREIISKKCSEASDWLYEQGDDTPTKEYVDKLHVLVESTKDLKMRVKEILERPEALEALRNMLNQSEYFLKSVRNLTLGDDPVFTLVEANTLGKLINETYAWRDNMIAEQAKTPNYEKPKLLVEDIALKIRDLDREVNYLLYKAKSYKAKPKTKPQEKSNTTNSTDKADSTKKPKAENETKDTESAKPTEKNSKKEPSKESPSQRNNGEL